jgi:integrase
LVELFKKYRRYEYKKWLDEDPNLRRWYFNTIKGSVMTADVYLRKLGNFCRMSNLTPGEYAKLPKRKMEELAFDYITEMEQKTNPLTGKKYAPSYIECYLKAIISWAKWNRKTFEMKIKIADLSKRPTVADERIPTNEELRRVLYADTTPLRTRVAIAIIAFSGCRLGVLGNYLGTDGLKLKDLPELVTDGGKVSFKSVPTLVVVRPELSKSRYWYPTFLLEEGCNLLQDWLELRTEYGERLGPESGIIVTTERMKKIAKSFDNKDPSPFLATSNISNELRRAMRASKLPWRPYIFRSYFDTQQMLAESKGAISHPYAQLFMGHGGDIESIYTVRKGELPPELMEDMRAAYGRLSELLGTRKQAVSISEIELVARKGTLALLGFTEQEIDNLGDLSQYSLQDLKKISDEKKYKDLGLNGKSTQKIIPWNDVRQAISDGWELVSKLEGTNEAIIRLPK